MIASLSGIITEHYAPYVVIEAGGVGYEVQVTAQDQTALTASLGAGTAKLYTHQIVREDGQWLFGFLQRENRDLFRLLIKINGLGPKIAMQIIAAFSVSDLADCVQKEDVRRLSGVPGVSARLAEKLMVEFKSKVLPKLNITASDIASGRATTGVNQVDEAISALTQLGYKSNQAIKLVAKIPDYQQLSCEELIREALKAAASS